MQWGLECHHGTKWSHSPNLKICIISVITQEVSAKKIEPFCCISWSTRVLNTIKMENKAILAHICKKFMSTWAPLSFTNSTDHLPSYWIHTNMPPSISQVASFWKGSFQRTKTTCKYPKHHQLFFTSRGTFIDIKANVVQRKINLQRGKK